MGGPLTNTVSILSTATCNACTYIGGDTGTHTRPRAAFNRDISFYLAPKRRGLQPVAGAEGPGLRNVTSMFRVDFNNDNVAPVFIHRGRITLCFLLRLIFHVCQLPHPRWTREITVPLSCRFSPSFKPESRIRFLSPSRSFLMFF